MTKTSITVARALIKVRGQELERLISEDVDTMSPPQMKNLVLALAGLAAGYQLVAEKLIEMAGRLN